MTDAKPSFLRRIPLAFGTFFAILGNPELAAAVLRLRRGAPEAPQPEAPAKAAPLHEAAPESALQLLGLLQREARFIDFVEEDVKAYSDADIGAAARLVHDGCRKALHEHFTLRPVRDEAEGARLTLPEGFDASAIRVTGKVVGRPPFSGQLTHRGWRITEARLPRLANGHDPAIVAPAEVEL